MQNVCSSFATLKGKPEKWGVIKNNLNAVPWLMSPFFLQSLDKNCLGPLRKAYCSSLNLLLRREVRNKYAFLFTSDHWFIGTLNWLRLLKPTECLKHGYAANILFSTVLPFCWSVTYSVHVAKYLFLKNTGSWIRKWASCKHKSITKSYCLARRIYGF